MNLMKIKDADGLTPVDAALLDECLHALVTNEAKHRRRHEYYEDRIDVPDRGMKMPEQYKHLRFCTGWAAKTVNMLAERSMLDSFTFADGIGEELADALTRAMAANKLRGKYDMAMPTNLTEGVGFWTVAKGDALEPDVTVKYNDAMTSGGVWDYKHDRVKACLVVTDYRRFGKGQSTVPCECVLYTDSVNIVLTREEHKRWRAKRMEHSYGRAMAVSMAYKPSGTKPFGKSRITPACMTYIDQMMQELRNMAVQSDIFSVPMKYFLGLSADQYDAVSNDLMDMYLSIFFGATLNEAGTNPLVGMLQAADMTPHIAAMDKIASLMASETCLPVATFGVNGNGYTSSDALRASTDDIVMLARSVNRHNGECLQEVAAMMAAILANEEGGAFRAEDFTPHFVDPSMPSDAANADAQTKIASVVPEYAGSEVFWERLGYPEDDRKRVMGAMATGKTDSLIKAALTGGTNAG